MAIVLRIVKRMVLYECILLTLSIHVQRTYITESTLKREISNILFHDNFIIQNIWCQGYDGVSNMWGDVINIINM